MKRLAILTILCGCLLGVRPASADEKMVSLLKTPDHGIQPQAVVDDHGNVHVLYFTGTPGNGNLMYMRRAAGETAFSHAMRVNSQDGSAIATGTIRGGQLAVGKNGRVHVAWNGSGGALPKNPINGAPMMYARLSDDKKSFEHQRNLMTKSSVLDGGGALAADAHGNVYVAWHGIGQGSAKGEDNRKVWVAMSNDEGKHFAAEKSAWDEPTGACGCCGMRGFADHQGDAYFLYRAASDSTNRGMYLLRSGDHGKSFAGRQLDQWKIASCPMSSEAFAEGASGIFAAWENDGQIFFTRLQSGKFGVEPAKAAPGAGGNRKHPALAVNKSGDVILAWTEGTGWNRGGTLSWQVYDKTGHPTAESGHRSGAIPVWGLPAVVAERDGRFTILH